jgi:hypothetical protein
MIPLRIIDNFNFNQYIDLLIISIIGAIIFYKIDDYIFRKGDKK